MTGLDQLRALMAQHGQVQAVGLLDAAISLSGQVGELSVLRALIDMATQAASLSGHDARCTVMEAMAEGGEMVNMAHRVIQGGGKISLVAAPGWAADAAGRA